MRYFLGIDVGGTKTHALIADEAGRAIGFGAGGPGNHQSVGFDGLRAVLRGVIQQALDVASPGSNLAPGQAGATAAPGSRLLKEDRLRIEQISGAGFGIAGYDWPSQLPAHQEVIASLGLICPVAIANDSIIGLLAGAKEGWGVVLIAGTGNNCRGRDKNGREGRITGEGLEFGEFGGSYDIIMKAIHAVAFEWSRRGKPTMLTRIFLDLTGAKDLDDLIEGLDLGRYEPDAPWAPAVFQAAYAGDLAAKEVLDWAGRELGESACGVIRQLGIEHEAFEVVMAGSVFEGGELYIEPLRQTIHSLAPKARLVRLDAPPVVGGVLLGMEQVLGGQAYNCRDTLLGTARLLRGLREV